MSKRLLVILGLCAWVVVGLTLAAFAVPKPAPPAPLATSIPPPMVAIKAGEVAGPINLWRDYADRSKGVAGTVQDGERVYLLEKTNDAALVRTQEGTRGWLNIAFIRP